MAVPAHPPPRDIDLGAGSGRLRRWIGSSFTTSPEASSPRERGRRSPKFRRGWNNLGGLVRTLCLASLLVVAQAALEDMVYWVTQAEGKVFRANVDGTGQELVRDFSSEGRVLKGIAIDESRCTMYLADSTSNSIIKMPLDGGGTVETFTSLLGLTTENAADTIDDEVWNLDYYSATDSLYWVTAYAMEFKADLAADTVTLMENYDSGYSGDGFYGLAVNTLTSPETLYYTASYDGFRINTHEWGSDIGDEAVWMSDTTVNEPVALAIDGTNLYWADIGSQNLWKAPLSSSADSGASSLSGISGVRSYGLAVDSTSSYLYYGDRASDTVNKIDLSDNSNIWTLSTSANGLVGDIALLTAANIDRYTCFTTTTTSTQTVTVTTSTTSTSTATTTVTTFTVTSTSSTSTQTTTSTITTSTTVTTTGTTTTTTATSTTTSTVTSTVSTTSTTTSTTTMSTTSTQTSTTETSTTSTSSTQTKTTSTLTTSTTTTTTSTSTVTTTTSQTSTETTVTETATKTSTTITSTTTLTKTSTTRTVTVSTTTTTTTVHESTTFYGLITLLVSNVDRIIEFWQSDTMVESSLQEGLAASFTGLSSSMITISSFTAPSNTTGQGNTILQYAIRVPTSVAKTNGITTATIQSSGTTIAVQLNATLAWTAVEVLLATMGTVSSETGLSVTTTTITTTTTGWSTPMANVVGSVSFSTGDATTKENVATAVTNMLVTTLGISSSDFTVSVQEVDRRLQEESNETSTTDATTTTAAAEEQEEVVTTTTTVVYWLVTYTATLTPEVAATVTAVSETITEDEVRTELINELVTMGEDRTTLETTMVMRALETVTVTSITGPTVTEACGEDFCPSGYSVVDGVSTTVCANQLNCSEALLICCEPTVATTLAGGGGSDESDSASSVVVALLIGGGAVILIVAVSFSLIYVRLKRRAEKQILSKYSDGSMPTSPGSNSRVIDAHSFEGSPTSPTSGRPPRSPRAPIAMEGDEQVVEMLLNDLQGEWRLHDGKKALPGLIEIKDQGYVLYDGCHWDTQDLLADAAGIYRADGWRVDMNVSDTDELEWMKEDDAGHTIIWKRCQGVSSFSPGDVVSFVGDEEPVQGTVIGFTDTRIKVRQEAEFEGDLTEVVEAQPHELEIVKRANPELEGQNRTLPSLTLCLEFKRLAMLQEMIVRENDELAAENTELRTELTGHTMQLDRENSRLRAQIQLSDALQRELTNTLSVNQQNWEIQSQNDELRQQVSRAGDLQREFTNLSQQHDKLAGTMLTPRGRTGLAGTSSGSFPSSGGTPRSAAPPTPLAPPAGGNAAIQAALAEVAAMEPEEDDEDDEWIPI